MRYQLPLALSLLWLAVSANAGEVPYKETNSASVARGATVYGSYCALCHGSALDGKGRAAKLYSPPPANLVASDKNREYKEFIVRRGGAAIGRSEFMPPWDEELTDEQITDLLNYVETASRRAESVTQGETVYNTYCTLCHGSEADGRGRAAKMYTPAPANLVTSDKNREYKELIVRRGGAALGRSEFMPPWGEELSESQIGNLLDYLDAIAAEGG